jgi:hypothetical protein
MKRLGFDNYRIVTINFDPSRLIIDPEYQRES